MFGRPNIDDDRIENRPSANATRMPKKIVSASSRRNPACTSRSRRLPISFGDRGAFSPIRLSMPISDW